MPGQRIYLDFNATTPIAPEVAAKINQALMEPFGNPSSEHWAGLPARQAVENARGQVAALLQCSSEEIVLTSGGTESNNHALKGSFFAKGGQDRHIITTQIEHPAVLNPCRFLERLGASVTYLLVDDECVVYSQERGDHQSRIHYRTPTCSKAGCHHTMTPWLGLQFKGLHYAQTGVIEQD